MIEQSPFRRSRILHPERLLVAGLVVPKVPGAGRVLEERGFLTRRGGSRVPSENTFSTSGTILTRTSLVSTSSMQEAAMAPPRVLPFLRFM